MGNKSEIRWENAGICSVDALHNILNHQDKLSTVEHDIANITQAISNQMQKIQEARSTPVTIEPLKRKREDILAEIAIGGETQAALDRIDEEIQGEIERHNKAFPNREQDFIDGQHALVGLRRRLEVAKSREQRLLADNEKLIQQFIRQEKERACESYIEAAAAVQKAFLTIVALNEISTERDRSTNVLRVADIFLPKFDLPQCEGIEIPAFPHLIFNMVHARTGGLIAETREKIIDWFKESGITII